MWTSLLHMIRSAASNTRRVLEVATDTGLAPPSGLKPGRDSTVFQASPPPGIITDTPKQMPVDCAGLPVMLGAPRTTGSVRMKCLIIAAGEGSRLRRNGSCKPLTPILGVPLIERVIRSGLEAGADDFYVVTGYQGRRVQDFLNRLTDRLGVHITPIVNEDWKKENGLSVLKARKYLRGSFLLLMS